MVRPVSETAAADGDTRNEHINDDEEAKYEHIQDEHTEHEHATVEHMPTREERIQDEHVKDEHTQAEHTKIEHIQDEQIMSNKRQELILDICCEVCPNTEQSQTSNLKSVHESSAFLDSEPTFTEVENLFPSARQPSEIIHVADRKSTAALKAPKRKAGDMESNDDEPEMKASRTMT